MPLPDIRNFEGQPWSAISKFLDKESGSKKISFASDSNQQGNSICLNIEDMSLYGKYPGAEPFILCLCQYCGDRLKVAALADHLALRHPNGRTIENPEKNSIKGDAKSPISILKKNKIKPSRPNKESSDIAAPPSFSSPVKMNKPSKVLIQVDRRRVNCTSNKDVPPNIFITPNSNLNKPSEIKEFNKSNFDITKNDQIKGKIEPTKVKKMKEDRGSLPNNRSAKILVNGTTDNLENSLFSRSKDKSAEHVTRKVMVKNNCLFESENSENIKHKVQDNGFSKGPFLPVENGISEEHSDDNNIESKRRLKDKKVIPKTRTYNPDRHCGVIGKENSKPCTRSLSCKSHTMSLRRAVRGRSKNFDLLLADHRAEKETAKHKLHDIPKDIKSTPELMNELQLTPIKIPLVLNPQLSQLESVKDILPCNLLNKNLNGIKMICDIKPEINHSLAKHHFQSNNIPRKKLKGKKKLKLTSIRKSQVKCFSQWHPWGRRIGGMLYTHNNLPSFITVKNVKKKVKSSFTDRKDNSKYLMNFCRNCNDSKSFRSHMKPPKEYSDYRSLTVDFRLQYINLKNSSSTQMYSLEDVKDVYFKLIPEHKLSTILRIKNESLVISFPPSNLPHLSNSISSDNQFLIQKKRDFPYIHRFINNYINSEESSSESDGDDLLILEDITDIRYSIMDPVKISKNFNNANRLPDTPLSGNAFRFHKFPFRPDEQNFNLGIGTLCNGQVCLETFKRLHFVTPSGPMAVALKQHPVIPEGSSDLVKSTMEE